MSTVRIFLMALLAMSSGIASAEWPHEASPQVGLHLTKHFGASSSQPFEMGASFNYGAADSNYYNPYANDYRPAMFSFKLNSVGHTAFEASGINVLQPAYVLGADEEEGFFSGMWNNINWGLVGLVALAGVIYKVAEDDRDDREERINELEAETEDGSATGS
ncbi:MAG: hypothetical protein ACPHER_05070 [Nevskiales bacterium]